MSARHSVEVDKETEKKLLQENSSDLFPQKTSASNDNEIASGFILFNIIRSVYNRPTMKNFRTILFLTILSLSVTPFLVKVFIRNANIRNDNE
jgi:hypothetical protein